MPTRTDDHTRGALNRLICVVSEELLVLDAAERIMESSSLRSRLQRQTRRRRSALADLSSALLALGGSPNRNAGWDVRLAHVLRDIPRLLAGAHQGDTMSVCARATAKTERSYWKALRDTLPTSIRSFVEPQYRHACRDALELRRLRWGASETPSSTSNEIGGTPDGPTSQKVWHEEQEQDVDLKEWASCPR